ncbi:MAG: transposase [Akkermansiaceae bacterium]|nr:transposase [Akkermansiaceae bacterium]
MYQPRFLSPSAEVSASVYHCVSRVIDRRFVLGRDEKDVFVRMMREYEAFCGVRVLSYCVMSNHFHLLVEVPPKARGAAVEMGDDEFLKRMKTIYSKLYYLDIEQMVRRLRRQGADAAVEEFKAKYTRRMHDLSSFMKGLKQRFTQWYNGKKARKGTLWEGRFKSVLVQDGYAARVMSAYIDLNPIRAGMVEKPEDYKWSSYGEAMQPTAKRGRKLARDGYCRILAGADDFNLKREGAKPLQSWGDGVAERYRMMLFTDGEEVFAERRETGGGVKQVRKGFRRQDVEKVLAKGGKLSIGEALRCRVRYFSDGVTFGSRDFVDKVFKEARERFSEKRKTGARPLSGVGWRKKQTRLYSMRQLVKERLE